MSVIETDAAFRLSDNFDMQDHENFRRAVKSMACKMYIIAKEHGFWDEEVEFGTKIALMHSELSEALEADRHGNPASEKIPGYSQIEEELADTVIRILDYAGANNLDLGGAIVDKAVYNSKRPHKHGKKF